MNYPDSVRFLYALGNELKTAKFDLERIRALLERLGSPELGPARVIHVAGTNGKGSTCAMIEAGLRAAGVSTGLYTSPHLLKPVERIRIDGEPVSPAEFSEAFDRVHGLAEQMIEEGIFDLHPSYFETVTAMAFLLFRARKVEWVVLETGLGGRLDATNVVKPSLCVLTPIDFDHEKFLGTSIEAIAAEKAGILKPGIPVVVAPQRPEAELVIRSRAKEIGAPYIAAWSADQVTVHRRGSRIETHSHVLACPLAGRHQVVNALAAATALTELGFDPSGLSGSSWPGRLERVHEQPEVILDGAHNPAGARALADYVDEFYKDCSPILIFGTMRDKAVDEIAGVLFPHFAEVLLTAPQEARALAPEALARVGEHGRLRICEGLEEALKMVLKQRAPVFVSGSLFLVGEATLFFKEME